MAPSQTPRTDSSVPATNEPASSTAGGSFLTKYFMVILFGFACLSLALNSRFTQVVVEDVSIIESVLQDSIQRISLSSQRHPVMDDDHARQPEEEDSEADVDHQAVLEKQQQDRGVGANNPPGGNKNHVNVHKIANLNCDAYGGPSQELAQEMVYWEDILQDAEYVSPFHRTNRDKTMTMTQFLTFEPDHGGWNNIRMAMGTSPCMHHRAIGFMGDFLVH